MAIRKVDLKAGEVSTFAGTLPGVKKIMTRDGPATEARFHPGGGPDIIFYDRKGDRFFCRSDDETSSRVIVRDGDGWCVRTFMPGTICGVDSAGNVYLPGAGGIQVARCPEGGAR